jgi:hypothetical protein
MAQNVGIANVGSIRRIQLIFRNVDDLDGIGRWKFLPLHYSTPISTQTRNLIMTTPLTSTRSQLPSRLPYPFRQPYSNFKFFKNFAPPFPDMTSDATDDRSEVICFLGGGEGSLTLFGPAESSSNRTALLCGNTAYCSLVCERSGSCYRRAVFIGDDLAAQGSPCSSPPHREGAILGPVRRGPLSGTLESIDQHQYCGYATRSKSFLFRPCLPA